MSSAYFASLVALPEIVKAPGYYRTRCGEVVHVAAVACIPGTEIPKAGEFAAFGTYPGGIRERWHRSGRVSANYQTPNDIVEAA